MTNLKSTKGALLSSVVALFLCFAMLLGTTFAWFTDSAVSSGNKIVAGDLDVELYQFTKDENGDIVKTNISETKKALFSDEIVWEPGKTEVVYLAIENEGSLSLKYNVAVEVTGATVSNYNLTDVMEYAITVDENDQEYGYVTSWTAPGTKVELGYNEATKDVELLPKDENGNGGVHKFALAIHMLESAGNEYMGKSITFDIKVLAGQGTAESDSFGNTYDQFAGYPGAGFAPALKDGEEGTELAIVGDDGYKVGSIMIPADAANTEGAGFTAKVIKTTYEGNFTIAAGMESVAYEVSVEGLKADNDVPVKAQLRIATGLDPETVSLYHYDTQIDCEYDPYTGYVSFETTNFSPFTIVFDADSKYEAPAIPEDMERPTAKVTYAPDWVGTEIAWGSYGQWSPTAGLEATLDAAFIFECPELSEEVRDAYKYWLCDFYVSLDRNLTDNQIFLGGQYGDFLVGFHNGDLNLPANEELPLLGTALSGGRSNWTYADVESFVGTFKCGVGDVNGALEGATFTVKLRLTNPENEAEFYDVNVVTYTFGGDYSIK